LVRRDEYGVIILRSNAHMPAEWRPVGDFLALIGDKWTVMIIGALGDGKRRFNELKRDIDGISQKMLSAKLRVLERDGLVSRTFFPVIPPRVEYELTALGHQLLRPPAGLAEFALMNQFQVEHSRRRFDEMIDQGAVAVTVITADIDRSTH
jgi:DNA-binding HxlR family transcriptional regulator